MSQNWSLYVTYEIKMFWVSNPSIPCNSIMTFWTCLKTRKLTSFVFAPNGLHSDQANLILDAGKHVVCKTDGII